MNTTLNIGLAGLGTVGGGLVRLLSENAEEIRARSGCDFYLKAVAVRNPNRKRDLPEGVRLTTDPMTLADDPDIDVVIELMGGIDTAKELITRSLAKGKQVVTANKALLAEEGEMDSITMISESGSVGGVPGGGPLFGCHFNNECSTDQKDHFDWFDGTGLDFGVFGLSEAQEDGSINVSKLNGVTLGVGGFTNITAGAKKACFIGTFTAKGLKEHIEDGKLVIDQEGQLKKFVKKSEQIAYDAPLAVKNGKPALYITERCVFESCAEGLKLIEIAPGVDIEKDILPNMEFAPIIPEGGPKLMPAEIFQENWGGLSALMDAKEAK